jgi:hypothetical protein
VEKLSLGRGKNALSVDVCCEFLRGREGARSRKTKKKPLKNKVVAISARNRSSSATILCTVKRKVVEAGIRRVLSNECGCVRLRYAEGARSRKKRLKK